MDNTHTIRNIFVLTGVGIALIAASFLWYIISRAGLIAVDVVVVPSDAKVQYEFGAIRDGVNHLHLGEHEVTVSRSGFSTKKYMITVTPDTKEIPITTEPVSEEGRTFLKDNPHEDQRYEIVGALLRKESSDKLYNQYPKLSDLPKRSYTRTGVYTIGYSGADADGNLILTISNSSTDGRHEAYRWIRNNFDMSQVIVRYSDYVSPIVVKRDA